MHVKCSAAVCECAWRRERRQQRTCVPCNMSSLKAADHAALPRLTLKPQSDDYMPSLMEVEVGQLGAGHTRCAAWPPLAPMHRGGAKQVQARAPDGTGHASPMLLPCPGPSWLRRATTKRWAAHRMTERWASSHAGSLIAATVPDWVLASCRLQCIPQLLVAVTCTSPLPTFPCSCRRADGARAEGSAPPAVPGGSRAASLAAAQRSAPSGVRGAGARGLAV